MISEPKRLHPISAIINCIKHIKELIFPFLLLVVFGNNGGFVQLLITAGVIVLVLITGILSWLRFTYRLEEGELRIEYGILIRKKRYIPFERIQSLDLSEGLLQRPFGLVKMKVETAGSSGPGGAEAVLTAISKDEANFIQQAFSSAKDTAKKDSQEAVISEGTEEILYKISSRELLLLASTSGGVGVVISAVFAFFFQFEEVIPYEKVFNGLERFVSNGIIFVSILVFIGFLIAWMAALVGTMLKYANFTVKKSDNDFIISRGLLEKRQITIPLHRIQAIRISENLLRQPIGFATVFVESAGGSIEDNDSARVMLLPIIKKHRIIQLLAPSLTEYHFNPAFTSAPKRALSRYIWRGLFIILPFIAVPVVFFRPWGYLALLLIFISGFWSFLKYKDAGWNLTHQQLTLRYRTLIKNTVLMRKNRIQSLSVHESFFQSRKSLGTINAVVMSGTGGTGGTVVDLEKKDVYSLYKVYSYTKTEGDHLDFRNEQKNTD